MDPPLIEPVMEQLSIGERTHLVLRPWLHVGDAIWVCSTMLDKQRVKVLHLDFGSSSKATVLDAKVTEKDPMVVLEIDQMSAVFLWPESHVSSLTKVIETCAGMGALGRGAEQAGFQIVARNELQEKACQFLTQQDESVVFPGDIGSVPTLASLLRAQLNAGVLTAGVSCQPYSRMGDKKGSDDTRADCLVKVLKAAYLLQVQVVVLECVAEATQFPSFVETIKQYCCEWFSSFRSSARFGQGLGF